MKSKVKEWISVEDKKPQQTGQYQVKTNHGNSVAFLTRNLKGQYTWLCVNEDYKVTHYLK